LYFIFPALCEFGQQSNGHPSGRIGFIPGPPIPDMFVRCPFCPIRGHSSSSECFGPNTSTIHGSSGKGSSPFFFLFCSCRCHGIRCCGPIVHAKSSRRHIHPTATTTTTTTIRIFVLIAFGIKWAKKARRNIPNWVKNGHNDGIRAKTFARDKKPRLPRIGELGTFI
jgi:hypothetical protein